jgi:hypothetical protein
MKPAHANLAVLALLIGATLAVFLVFGAGVALQATTTIFGIGWSVQFLALAWTAYQGQPPPEFTSTHLFALWAGAIYPFLGLLLPQAPLWFVLASAPIGYVMVYAMGSLVIWRLRAIADGREQRRTP